jgi:hypothetical protein
MKKEKNKIINGGDVIIGAPEIKMMTWDYYEQFYANKLDNLKR